LGAETEVGQLEAILGEEQDIFRLDVPMHVAQTVLQVRLSSINFADGIIEY